MPSEQKEHRTFSKQSAEKSFFQSETRKLTSLRRGDIININVPFEENTRDYYNGYKPEEVRGALFTDRFGNSSKSRMVVYIGRDEDTMLYVPLTSKTGKSHDIKYQYELKDNSMTPRKFKEMKSYVEADFPRAIRISYHRELPYTARISNEDLYNIMERITSNTMRFNSERDQRGYIPPSMEEEYVEKLTHHGYILEKETERKKTYTKKETGQTIVRTKYGEVYYHREKTIEEVREMVSRREGRAVGQPEEKEELSLENTEGQNKYHWIKSKQQNSDIRKQKRPQQSLEFSKNINQLSKRGETYANTC